MERNLNGRAWHRLQSSNKQAIPDSLFIHAVKRIRRKSDQREKSLLSPLKFLANNQKYTKVMVTVWSLSISVPHKLFLPGVQNLWLLCHHQAISIPMPNTNHFNDSTNCTFLFHFLGHINAALSSPLILHSALHFVSFRIVWILFAFCTDGNKPSSLLHGYNTIDVNFPSFSFFATTLFVYLKMILFVMCVILSIVCAARRVRGEERENSVNMQIVNIVAVSEHGYASLYVNV